MILFWAFLFFIFHMALGDISASGETLTWAVWPYTYTGIEHVHQLIPVDIFLLQAIRSPYRLL